MADRAARIDSKKTSQLAGFSLSLSLSQLLQSGDSRSSRGFEIAVGIALACHPPRGPGRALVSASGSDRG